MYVQLSILFIFLQNLHAYALGQDRLALYALVHYNLYLLQHIESGKHSCRVLKT